MDCWVGDGVDGMLLTSVAQSGTIRHNDLDGIPGNDPDEFLYVAYGNNYPSVGGFHANAAGTTTPGFFGSGTLLDATHVLTAAHVADDLPPTGLNFRIGGKDYRTSTVTPHPQYADTNTGSYADLAVVELTTPVINVAPAVMYAGALEVGQNVDLIGCGLGGTGSIGYQERTSAKRGGQNVIDGLGEDTTFGVIFPTTFPDKTLLYDFDKPGGWLNPMGSDTLRPLEYHLAPGDSGGGWFIDVGGEKKLVGVTSYGKDLGVPGGVPYGDGFYEGKYYEIGVGMRVSAYRTWIESHLGVDLDHDGRYDVEDYAADSRIDPATATGTVYFPGIEDMDGVNEFTNASGLNLTNNQITSIESGDFSGLGSLQSLYLRNTQITSIESGDFSGLGSLQDLLLTNNQITSIESGAFSGLGSLQDLLLTNNQITSIESGDFSDLGSLQMLILNSNQITSIESGAFSGLGSLQRLDLHYNQITSLNLTDADLTALNRLRLDISEIDTLILDGATLSQGSFDVIVNSASAIVEGRLVDTDLTDTTSLNSLLSLGSLHVLTVDPAIYQTWQGDLGAWDTNPSNTLNLAVRSTPWVWDGSSVASVSGTASLASTLSVVQTADPTQGNALVGVDQQVTILTAAGGVSGTFTTAPSGGDVLGLGLFAGHVTAPGSGATPPTFSDAVVYGAHSVQVKLFQALAGDSNLDKRVDVNDRIVWNSNKFTSGKNWFQADWTGDGNVDINDRIAWNTNKFTDYTPVPAHAAGLAAGPAQAGITAAPEFVYNDSTGELVVITNGHYMTDMIINLTGDESGAANEWAANGDSFLNDTAALVLPQGQWFAGAWQLFDANSSGANGNAEPNGVAASPDGIILLLSGLSLDLDETAFGIASWGDLEGVAGAEAVTIVSTVTGDTNDDQIVDNLDYNNLVAQFGGLPGVDSADFNGDGIVDLADFAIMRGNFGAGGTASAPEAGATTPEPGLPRFLGPVVMREPLSCRSSRCRAA
jgi:hypothetical protein